MNRMNIGQSLGGQVCIASFQALANIVHGAMGLIYHL